MLDGHTHSYYSMDSKAPSEEMVRHAIDLGMEYLAITDHYNADSLFLKEEYRANSLELKYPLDIEGHIRDVKSLQDKYKDSIYVAVGMEYGYSRESESLYIDNVNRADLDVVVNSIHLVENEDIYLLRFYENRTREYAMKSYLAAIRESVDARYDYDVIGHIGYMSRKAPYEHNLFTMDEFGEEIDDILKAIIRRDKCLECNTKTKTLPLEFLPGREILTRYYELGGRKVSFGSDAHNVESIATKYHETAEILKEIGFSGFTYYVKGEPRLAKW